MQPTGTAAALALALALLAPLGAGPASAQGAGMLAEAAASEGRGGVSGRPLDSPAAVRAMVARLSDAEVRALLLDRLDAQAAERADQPDEAAALAMSLSQAGRGFVASVGGAVERLANVPGAVGAALGRFWEPRGLLGTLHLLGVLALSLATGRLAERGLRRLARAQWQRLWAAEWEGQRLGRQIGFLVERLGLETVEAAAFLLAAWAVIRTLAPPEPMSDLILSFFLWGPVLWVRATALATRFVFASNRAGLRLVNVTDDEARFVWMARGMQGHREPLGRVIECALVSGL